MARKYTASAHIVADESHGNTIDLVEIIRPAQFSEFTTVIEVFEQFSYTLAPNESLKKIAITEVVL